MGLLWRNLGLVWKCRFGQEPPFLDHSYHPSCAYTKHATPVYVLSIPLSHHIVVINRMHLACAVLQQPCHASYNCKPTFNAPVCTTCLIPRCVMRSHRRHQPRIEFLRCLLNGRFLYSVENIQTAKAAGKIGAVHYIPMYPWGYTPLRPTPPLPSPKQSHQCSMSFGSTCVNQSCLRRRACIRCNDNSTYRTNTTNFTPPKAKSGKWSRNTPTTRA